MVFYTMVADAQRDDDEGRELYETIMGHEIKTLLLCNFSFA